MHSWCNARISDCVKNILQQIKWLTGSRSQTSDLKVFQFFYRIWTGWSWDCPHVAHSALQNEETSPSSHSCCRPCCRRSDHCTIPHHSTSRLNKQAFPTPFDSESVLASTFGSALHITSNDHNSKCSMSSMWWPYPSIPTFEAKKYSNNFDNRYKHNKHGAAVILITSSKL